MNEVTVQVVARTRALRAPCGEEVWVFSLFGVKVTPKSEKTPMIFGSAEALASL